MYTINKDLSDDLVSGITKVDGPILGKILGELTLGIRHNKVEFAFSSTDLV